MSYRVLLSVRCERDPVRYSGYAAPQSLVGVGVRRVPVSSAFNAIDLHQAAITLPIAFYSVRVFHIIPCPETRRRNAKRNKRPTRRG